MLMASGIQQKVEEIILKAPVVAQALSTTVIAVPPPERISMGMTVILCDAKCMKTRAPGPHVPRVVVNDPTRSRRTEAAAGQETERTESETLNHKQKESMISCSHVVNI